MSFGPRSIGEVVAAVNAACFVLGLRGSELGVSYISVGFTV